MIYNVYMFCLLIFAKILKSIMSLFRRAINFFFLSSFSWGIVGKRRQVHPLSGFGIREPNFIK